MTGPEINFPSLSKEEWLEMVESDFKRMKTPFDLNWHIDADVAVERIRTQSDVAGFTPVPGITNEPFSILVESPTRAPAAAERAALTQTMYRQIAIEGSDQGSEHQRPEIHLMRSGTLLFPARHDNHEIQNNNRGLDSHYRQFASAADVLFVTESSSSTNSHTTHLADTLHEYALLLDRLQLSGLAISEIYGRVAVILRLSSDFLIELCKMRALRLGMCQILTDFGCDVRAVDRTVIWAATDVQPDASDYSYLVHQTESISAAVLGGCNCVVVPDHNNKHLTLGIPRLLAHESKLHSVGDVCHGSYQLEHMTDELLAAAWSKFLAMTQANPATKIVTDCRTS